jgi:two-component system chemotaxis response regulator CheY
MRTILLVEDFEDLSNTLALRLNTAGFEVIQAFDGVNGLEKLGKVEADLMILDLHLPRLNGWKLLEVMRSNGQLREVPVLLLTGDPDPDLVEKARQWGVRDVLRKPVRQRKVVRAVKDILDGLDRL